MDNNEKWYAVAYDDGYWNWTKITPETSRAVEQGFDLARQLLREPFPIYIWPRDREDLTELLLECSGQEQVPELMALLGVHDDS
jgi:hypothetical protein